MLLWLLLLQKQYKCNSNSLHGSLLFALCFLLSVYIATAALNNCTRNSRSMCVHRQIDLLSHIISIVRAYFVYGGLGSRPHHLLSNIGEYLPRNSEPHCALLFCFFFVSILLHRPFSISRLNVLSHQHVSTLCASTSRSRCWLMVLHILAYWYIL